ncbi:MAG: hypothetical protein CMA31_01190 [Euryarchaeota archaeon]|nr:hypothetical protein [Euryarchaeota archaeon]
MKKLVFIIALLSLPTHGSSSEAFSIPFEVELSYEKLSKNDPFYIFSGNNGSSPERKSSNSSMMLQQVWKIKNFSKTTNEIALEIKNNIKLSNYETIYECDFKSCGGFEFRFNSNILDMPEMFVNLGNYKFLTVKALNSGPIKFISYVISVGKKTAYIQTNQFGNNLEGIFNRKTSNHLSKSLSANFNDNKGSIVVKGLKFKPGSADILESDLRILSDLANFLILNKKEKIILVGHTDASGPIEGNIKLSKDRAETVRKLFIRKFDVNPNQISINGVGYLSPIATNNTEAGREKNRRVEVIIVPKFN